MGQDRGTHAQPYLQPTSLINCSSLVAFLLMAGVVATTGSEVSAQDPSATPHFGTLNLSAGFTPDPVVRRVSGGGSVRTTQGGCTAHVSSAPDLDLNYQAGSHPLTITASSGSDVLLLINTPDGRWLCDDDSGDGTNARITISQPLSGNYNIWVGTYRRLDGNLPEAHVHISELGAAGTARSTQESSSGVLNWNANPSFGSIDLSAGFKPDPHQVRITAGGSDAVPRSLGTECRGFVNARAPDFDLNYTAGGRRLMINATSETDVTLVVNLPDGSWVCNDDGPSGSDPSILLESPQSGNYNIWIGTYRAMSPLPQSRLLISER
ncbi:hypothetical protein BH23GEM8_BH23GEM8_14550 [soil metagenome]